MDQLLIIGYISHQQIEATFKSKKPWMNYYYYRCIFSKIFRLSQCQFIANMFVSKVADPCLPICKSRRELQIKYFSEIDEKFCIRLFTIYHISVQYNNSTSSRSSVVVILLLGNNFAVEFLFSFAVIFQQGDDDAIHSVRCFFSCSS